HPLHCTAESPGDRLSPGRQLGRCPASLSRSVRRIAPLPHKKRPGSAKPPGLRAARSGTLLVSVVATTMITPVVVIIVVAALLVMIVTAIANRPQEMIE